MSLPETRALQPAPSRQVFHVFAPSREIDRAFADATLWNGVSEVTAPAAKRDAARAVKIQAPSS